MTSRIIIVGAIIAGMLLWAEPLAVPNWVLVSFVFVVLLPMALVTSVKRMRVESRHRPHALAGADSQMGGVSGRGERRESLYPRSAVSESALPPALPDGWARCAVALPRVGRPPHPAVTMRDKVKDLLVGLAFSKQTHRCGRGVARCCRGLARCCVDHVPAGWMFWFPRKKFVGSYFCLSAASRW
jgi:hypothetical protein